MRRLGGEVIPDEEEDKKISKLTKSLDDEKDDVIFDIPELDSKPKKKKKSSSSSALWLPGDDDDDGF